MLNKIIKFFLENKLVTFLFLIVFVLLFALLLIGLTQKDKLNNSLSKMIINQAGPELNSSVELLIDSLYNYSKNASSFEITFLEFGAKGCSACKRMEGVMDEIRLKYPDKVHVVFLNIIKPESQNLMKYYGISVIPTQILLNKNGKEYFRHTGYYSSKELTKKIVIDKKY